MIRIRTGGQASPMPQMCAGAPPFKYIPRKAKPHEKYKYIFILVDRAYLFLLGFSNGIGTGLGQTWLWCPLKAEMGSGLRRVTLSCL